MKISALQRDVREFSKSKGFENATIEERTLFLVTEIGEVAQEVLKISSKPDSENSNELKEQLSFEIYDVVWNLFDLANKLDIDLEYAFRKKSEINKYRHWDV
ncbi:MULTISPECIES: MazG-like family protein [unclassified Bacillus (in: firmicutes)]|uniref:MazG-like family protein n=1 Tax=unclassified Bacillus (in: firmicutes) TaxID=185979 RepID=UPI0008E2B0D2|nr:MULTISPECIES: MazG-like family protein [unclassified Bacillus (in: firmicutes)]SFI70564.1 NTP pyrophosphatase, house-cleaning of non-canonical NTPs [Bacillus sp. 71mf]SFS89435.1 NTP pyrophosphatase, house-cleaning of non-canonical NTPs [Bacillus sp. 103mf]